MEQVITIQEIRAGLQDEKTTFMRQGRGGKLVHISAGDVVANHVLHGATYSRSSMRQSYNWAISNTSIPVNSICKKCLAAYEDQVKRFAEKAGA